MKFFITFSSFLFLLLVISCSESKPLDKYSDDQLISILFDVHVANRLVNSNPKELRDSLKNMYFAQLQQIHDLQGMQLDSIIDLIHIDNTRQLRIYDSLAVRVVALMEDEKKKKVAKEKK